MALLVRTAGKFGAGVHRGYSFVCEHMKRGVTLHDERRSAGLHLGKRERTIAGHEHRAGG